MLNFDRKRTFVRRCRGRMKRHGCSMCKKVMSYGLYLKGEPRLTDMVRSGSSVKELKEAMRERGWYCKKCLHRQEGTAAAATLRDQFPTQEEYYEYLTKRGPISPY